MAGGIEQVAPFDQFSGQWSCGAGRKLARRWPIVPCGSLERGPETSLVCRSQGERPRPIGSRFAGIGTFVELGITEAHLRNVKELTVSQLRGRAAHDWS